MSRRLRFHLILVLTVFETYLGPCQIPLMKNVGGNQQLKAVNYVRKKAPFEMLRRGLNRPSDSTTSNYTVVLCTVSRKHSYDVLNSYWKENRQMF